VAKKKIVVYNGSLRMGGIERILIEVLKNINLEKYDIDLLIGDGTISENVFEKDVPQEISITYLRSEETINKTKKLKAKKKNFIYKLLYNLAMSKERKEQKENTLKYFRENSPELLIDFDMGLSKVAHLIEIPKIAWIHASIKNWYRKPDKIKRLGERLKNYDNVITICDDMKEETVDLYPFLKDKIHRIYNPLDIDRVRSEADNLEGLSEEERAQLSGDYIVSVMRLTTYQKDFETLIEAFKILKEKNIKEKLYILGYGPDEKEIETMIKESNLEDRVILLGQKKNPYPWIKRAKLFVHSSKFEGFGLVLAEALSLGKSVISSNCPIGPREVLEGGKVGVLYNVGDYEKLSTDILNLIQKEDTYKELAIASSKRFDVKEIMNEYEKIIDYYIK